MTPTEWGLLLLLSLMWGGSFFFIGVAVKALPPLTIVAARVSIAAALLWLAAPLTGVSPARLRSAAPALVLLALLNNVAPFSLLTWSQTHLASGLVSILNATTPVFTVVVAHLFTADEKLDAAPTRRRADRFRRRGGDDRPGAARRVCRPSRRRAGGAARGAVLCGGERLRAPLPPPWPDADRRRDGSGHALPASCSSRSRLLADAPWRLPAPGGRRSPRLLGLGALSTALAYVVYFRIDCGRRRGQRRAGDACSRRRPPSCSAPPCSANDWRPRTSSASA